MTTILALHGDFANGSMIRRDIGHISLELITPDWKRQPLSQLSKYSTLPNLVLAGYSKGAIVLPKLLQYLPNVIGIIAYEGPATCTHCQCTLPVIWITNSQGVAHRPRRRKKQMTKARSTWSNITPLQGIGRHIRTRPLGHNWNTSLNPKIVKITKSWTK